MEETVVGPTWHRGPLQEKVDREPGDSRPLPDDLVVAIAAAGLTGEDSGRCLQLFRDGRLTAYVTGHNAYEAVPVDPRELGVDPADSPFPDGILPEPVIVDYACWWARYGLDQQKDGFGSKKFRDQHEAVRYVLINQHTPVFDNQQLPGGRWQRGPMTAAAAREFAWVDDQVLVAAAALGVSLDVDDRWNYTASRDGEQIGTLDDLGLDGPWLLRLPAETAILDDRQIGLRMLIKAA